MPDFSANAGGSFPLAPGLMSHNLVMLMHAIIPQTPESVHNRAEKIAWGNSLNPAGGFPRIASARAGKPRGDTGSRAANNFRRESIGKIGAPFPRRASRQTRPAVTFLAGAFRNRARRVRRETCGGCPG